MIRRLILALLLMAGLVPAIAQAPPPVPALPDAPRVTQYTIASSNCNCPVQFALYGDGTDVDNWIQVFIGTTPVLSTDPIFGWSLTTPVGPLATIPRPITTAVLKFNSLQSGNITIIGARRPRRVSQFTENRGVAARDLNQAITDEIAMLREDWDLGKRGIAGQPGETLNLLPPAASRAKNFLGFDANGQPFLYPPNFTLPNSGAGAGVSITAYGAVADGVTDAGPAINSCIAAGNDCVVPPSANGFFINTTIQNTGSLRGTVFKPSNPSPSTTFPGTSFLLCSASVSPCVNNGGASLPNLGVAAYLSNLIVSRVAGTPTAGTIGVQWNGGYNATSQNIYAFNHDTCLKWFASAPSGIASHNVNLEAALCATHFIVDDGWPELQITEGRLGANGTGDYSTTQDFVLITNSACAGGGCGPNGLTLQNFQMNPGSNGPACAMRWANFTNPPGSSVGAETRLTDVHIEWHTAGTGVFCSDATAKTIQQVYMDHVETAVSGTSAPLFAFNAATNLTQWFVHDSLLGGCTGITLAPTPASGAAFSDVHFSRVFGCVGASFTSNGTGSNRLFLDGNTWGTFTVAGNWDGQLSSTNDFYSSLTDTATGHVGWSNPITQTWTPALTLGGGSTGITYSTQAGYFNRTSDGGYIAAFQIILSSKGSSTGSALITGLPKQCANGAQSDAAAGIAANVANMASLTGPVMFFINPATTNIVVASTGAAGNTQLADTNFTNTTQISGTVKCAQTP